MQRSVDEIFASRGPIKNTEKFYNLLMLQLIHINTHLSYTTSIFSANKM